MAAEMRKVGLSPGVLLLSILWCTGPSVASGPTSPDPATQYSIDAPKTVLELQQFRRTTTRAIVDPRGRRGTVTFMEINPDINAWYLVQLLWEDAATLQVDRKSVV